MCKLISFRVLCPFDSRNFLKSLSSGSAVDARVSISEINWLTMSSSNSVNDMTPCLFDVVMCNSL
ncbi:hypothetical protein D3C84_987000 [compost metagenome]